MKPLIPSHREKKRYLLIKGRIQDVENAIFNGIGVLGMSKAGWRWIKSSKETAIVSVNREMVDSIRACLAIWPEKIKVEKVSGTLKSIK